MLDLIIKGGQVVTPSGTGAWDLGLQGEKIVAVGLPGVLPEEGARIIDARGKIVVPGGDRAPCPCGSQRPTRGATIGLWDLQRRAR